MNVFLFAIIMGISIQSAQTPQKIKMSEDLLDRLNEIEKVYDRFLKSGMTPEKAAQATIQWQDTRYPVILNKYKSSTENKGR